MAAGLTVRRDRLDAFREAFNETARAKLSPEDLIPTQKIDAVVPMEQMDGDLERLLRHLEPCGSGNPAPVFGVSGANAIDQRKVGTNHLKFTLADGTGKLPAIAFNWADRVGTDWWREPVDVALKLERNEWRGRTSLQARVVQIKPADAHHRG